MAKRARATYNPPHDRIPQNARPGQRFRRLRRARRRPCPDDGPGPRRRRPAFRHRLRHGGGDAPRRRRPPTPVCSSTTPMAARSESCGNATRCVARLLMDERGLARVQAVHQGRPAGLQRCRQGPGHRGHGRAAPGLGQVPLAEPRSTRPNFPSTSDGSALPVPAPSRGQSPLRAVRAATPQKAPVAELGPKIETHPLFPRPHQCRIRPACWTRRASACGCGSAASASRWPAAPAPAPPRWRRSGAA